MPSLSPLASLGQSGVQLSSLSLNQMAVCVSVLTLLTLTKQSSVRYTQCLQWMRTSLSWETVRSSPNSTPTVGFSRFPWMTNQDCSQLLSHHLDVFVLTDYHLVSALPQRSSNALCPRYLTARKGHSVRWMMSSFTGWTSQNMMDA